MARSYSLAVILAIAIPLGTVALIGMLALTFILVRMSVISTRERRAYIMARNGDFRRRSAASSDSPRTYRGQRYRQRRGCCDFLCCVPATDDLFPLPAQYSYTPSRSKDANLGESSTNNKALATPEAKRVAAKHGAQSNGTPGSNKAARDSKEKSEKSEKSEKPEKSSSSTQLAKRTSAALEVAEKRTSQGSKQPKEPGSPPDFTPPKPPDTTEPEPPSPVMPHSSHYQQQKSLEAERELSAALSTPHTAHTRSESPLFVPSVWSYPASLSLHEGQSFKASRNSQSSRVPGDINPAVRPGRPSSVESPRKAEPDNALRQTSILSPLTTKMLSSPLADSQNAPQLLGPLSFEQTPNDLDFSVYYNMDLIPPAKNVLRSLKTPAASPISSSRGTNVTYSSESGQKTAPLTATPRNVQRPQRTRSSDSVYRTPPVAPLGTPQKQSGFLASPMQHSTEDAEPSIAGKDLNSELPKAPWAAKEALTATWDGIDIAASNGVEGAQRMLTTRNGATENVITAQPKTADKAADAASRASKPWSDDDDAIDPERQRILGLLKRNESLHRGNERVYRQHVEAGRAAIPSYSGSLVRDSGLPILETDKLETSLSADHIKNYKADVSLTNANYPSGAHSTTDIAQARAATTFEDRPSSVMSFAPTSLDKLFHASASEMRLPLLEGSDESKKSKREKGYITASLSSGRMKDSPLARSNSSIWLSSRSSSLTASWATAGRSSSNGTESHVASTPPPTTVRPLVVKTSNSIRNIALLSVPRSPRSPGYSPGQAGAHILTPDGGGSRRPGSYSSKAARRLSLIGHRGTNVFAKSPESRLHRRHSNAHSDKARGGLKKKPSSSRVRVPKSTRMNKPLPVMPNGAEEGLLANLNGARYFVVKEYTSNLNDEINLAAGEIVRVYQVFDDGWCLVRLDTDLSHKGICPHACLKALDN